MALTPEAVVDLYRRRARRYNLTANLYYLIGYREYAYRKRAVAALDLAPGDTVVEIGCGTGNGTSRRPPSKTCISGSPISPSVRRKETCNDAA